MDDPARRCLIVDGNFLIGLDLEEILLSLSIMNIDRAQKYEQAKLSLESQIYAIVFIDLELGLENVSRLLELAKAHGATSFFTTTDIDGHAYPPDASKLSIITKPYSIAAIKRILNSAS